MKTRALLIALVAVAVLAAVRLWRREPAARTRPSLLVVTIDTLRADRVGAYGADASVTPNIDALAGQGAVFEEALASVPLTLPSHATILSGLEPPHHGVHDNGASGFPQDRETLATTLKGRGYATGAFVGAYVLDRRFGLARGFDAYDDAIERRAEGASALESERPCDRVVAAAEEWLAKQAGPFFAWAHLYDPHAPYDPPPPHRERFAGRPYDGEVAYADACFGRLSEAARRRAGDALVVAVLSDHGESLGRARREHPRLLPVSADAAHPDGDLGPRRAHGRASRRPRADGGPVADAPAPARRSGAGRTRRRRPPRRPAATRELCRDGLSAHPRLGAPPFVSSRASLKYIDAPRPELYDLARDPGETDDLASARAEDAAPIGRRPHRASMPASGRRFLGTSDPEVAERLRALGYVTRRRPAPNRGTRARRSQGPHRPLAAVPGSHDRRGAG